MIVSFSGAQGTGKSQILARVMKLLPEEQVWSMKKSFSTASLTQFYEAEGLDPQVPWWELPCESQGRIQMLSMMNALTDLLEAKVSSKNWILDRCIFDAMAYTFVKYRQLMLNESIVKLLRATHDRVIGLVDMIVLFRPDPAYPIEPSVYRKQTDQAEVASSFDSLFAAIDNLTETRGSVAPKLVVVPNGTLDQKANFILSSIQSLRYSRGV